MATRTGYVGTQNVGDVLTSSNFSKLPGGLIAYVPYTSNSATFTNSETDLNANLTVTVATGTSRTIEVVCVGQAQSTVSGDDIKIFITTGVSGAGTDLVFTDVHAGGANDNNGFKVSTLVQTSGSQSFHVRAQRIGGTGNCLVAGNASAGSAVTGITYLAVYDVGPAF